MAERPIRVLHITMRWGEGRGGVKQFIRNAMDALPCDEYDQRILAVGGVTGEAQGFNILGSVTNRTSPRALLLAYFALTRRLKDISPDVVHIHCNNGLGFLYADAARRAGVSCRIVHSHSSALGDDSRAKAMMDLILKGIFSSSPTNQVACSEIAGSHMFGDGLYKVLRNGIDAEKFSFSSRNRYDIRAALGIPECAPVLGHIGSGIPVKNTRMAISAFESFLSIDSSAHLILIGDGTELADLKKYAQSGTRANRIHFVGTVSDPWRYYSALDVLMLPSFYEGLPICLIEAQANGLPCLVSDVVSAESDVTGIVQFESIQKTPEEWASCCAGILRANILEMRSDSRWGLALENAGFSLASLGNELIGLYGHEGVRV